MPTTNTTALEALKKIADDFHPAAGQEMLSLEEMRSAVLEWIDSHESSAPSAAEPVRITDLTPEQLADKCEAWLRTGTLTTNVVDAYEAGYRDCEAAHAAAPPAPAPSAASEREALTDEQWLDLAARHSYRDWGDEYFGSIKAVCADYAAMAQGER